LASPLQEHPDLAGQFPLMRLIAPDLFQMLLSRDQQLTPDAGRAQAPV
jgi:hypothetical protein